MSGNPIEDVPNVTNCTNLIRLDIKNTKITTLHEYQFIGLKKFRELWWGGSPFHCDCRLRWAVSDPRGFLHHGRNYEKDTCAEPPDKRGKLLKDLPPDDLVCASTRAAITTKRSDVTTISTGSNANLSNASSASRDIVTLIREQRIKKPYMGHNSKKTVITLCCFIVMIVLGMVAGAVFVFKKYKCQKVRLFNKAARHISSDSHEHQCEPGTEGVNSQDYPHSVSVNTLSPNQPVRMSCLMEADEMGEPI